MNDARALRWYRARYRAALGGATRAANQAGASLIEYALLLAFIAIVCVVALQLIGASTKSSLSSTASGLD